MGTWQELKGGQFPYSGPVPWPDQSLRGFCGECGSSTERGSGVEAATAQLAVLLLLVRAENGLWRPAESISITKARGGGGERVRTVVAKIQRRWT